MTSRLAQVARLLLTYACAVGTAFAATMPAQFVPNKQPIGWVGELEFTNGGDFSVGNPCLFKTDFFKVAWYGNVSAVPVDARGNIQAGASCWPTTAGEALDVDGRWTTRNIGTMKSDGTRIPFLWSSLGTEQKKLFFGGDATKGPNALNYIRGERANEMPSPGTLRSRQSILGDIVHSRPLYVYDPVVNTTPRLYVGGNDGMLHVFDATTDPTYEFGGKEVYAYIPSFLMPNLDTLWATTTPYVHQFFVDGTPNARYIAELNKTYLVVSVGAGAVADSSGKLLNQGPGIDANGAAKNGVGGAGIIALDISNPDPDATTQGAEKVLWEITTTSINNRIQANPTSYADLGFTYGIPLIVKLNTGGYGVVVGNGYAQGDGGSGQAVLYVIDLLTGAKIAGITATIGGAADDGHPNGLTTPAAVDVNGDGVVDYVYAGDLAGNMWKFDMRSSTAGSWTAFKLFATPNANTTTANAITGAPAIAFNPNGGLMVVFGTGRIFTNAATTTTGTPPDDQTSTTQQYVYGLWDTDFPASGTALSKTVDATKLVAQGLSSAFDPGKAVKSFVRTSSAINPVDYAAGSNQKQGWRLALASNGERIVGDGGVIVSGRYQVSTSNPNFDNGTDALGAAKPRGDNWLLEVDFLTGTSPKNPIFDISGDTLISAADQVADQCSGTTTGCTIPVARRILSGGYLSQPIVAELATNSQTYFNYNPDIEAVTSPGGVQNGHFDFDIYYNVCAPSGYKCGHHTHIHQYDDKFNVTGADMQNASVTAYNLSNAIPSTATKFKILVANQKLSPAIKLLIGDSTASYIPAVNYLTDTASPPPPTLGTGTTIGTNTPFSDALQVYVRKGGTAATGVKVLDNFYYNMPLYAFAQYDWVTWWSSNQAAGGTCDPATNANCRVGVIPSQTGCITSNKGGVPDLSTFGPYGNLWMNGGLTIQVIKWDTPDSAIRLARPGDPTFGYRLGNDTASQSWQLAQYTVFWHHPNGKCYGDAGWGTTAAIAYPDRAGSANAAAIAPGSDDPHDGSFTEGSQTGGGPQSGGSPPGTASTFVGPDGLTYTMYVFTDTHGNTTVTIVAPDGTTTIEVLPPGGGPPQEDARLKSGRQSWKQMLRP